MCSHLTINLLSKTTFKIKEIFIRLKLHEGEGELQYKQKDGFSFAQQTFKVKLVT